MWTFDLNTNLWEEIDIKEDFTPIARNGHSMIVHNNSFILFGGIRELTHERNDIWKFDTQTNKWSQLEQASSTRKMKPLKLK